jgi:hypothetical protein
MLTPEQINVTGANNVPVLLAPGDTTVVQVVNVGLGATVGGHLLNWRNPSTWVWISGIFLAFVV